VHTTFLDRLQTLLADPEDRSIRAKRIAEAIAAERHYRWVGLYEVTSVEIAMIACTGVTPPAFPRFPVTQGLCGATVATGSIVNSGNVQEDPRWLTTFGSTRSEVIVPVFEQGFDPCIGLIDVESDRLNAFSTDDELFLTSCASFLALLYR